MQQSVSSHFRWGLRALELAVVATIAVAVPRAALATMPMPMPMQSPSPSPTPSGTAVVTNLSATPTSFFSADLSAEVTSNGGRPPIYSRGFVYSETALNSTPERYGPYVGEQAVPGTLGVMNRTITGLLPNVSYSVQAWAENPDGMAYSGVKSVVPPCPAIVLPALPDGAVGAYYSPYVTALGSFGWDDYSVTAGSLPDGVDLWAYGSYAYLQGTPTTAGTFNFTITALDADYATGCGASRSYSVKIAEVDVSPRKLDFASELVGNTSDPKRVTISNNQDSDIPLALPFVFTGPFSASATDCTNPLPAYSVCTVDVVYTAPAVGSQTGTLALGPATVSLRGAGVSAMVGQVYVSNSDSNTVSVIDPATNAVRTVVVVGNSPANLAALPGGDKVYVPNQYSNSVSVIKTATNTVVATITDDNFQEPYAVAPTPLGDEVWVLSADRTDITIIDPVSDTVVGTVDGEACLNGPLGIVANPRTHEMYVLNTYGASVCVFDRVTRLYTRSFAIGGYPRYGVVLPDGSALYVDTSYNGVARVALPSGSVTYIPGADGRNMDMKADGSKIYIARRTNGFGVIDTATNTFTDIPLTGASLPYAVAVHDASGHVFVTDEEQNVVYVVDLATDVQLPNPELPIQDSSFEYPQAIASTKAAAPPVGLPPTVTSLAGTAGSVSASVSANVTSNGGMPIFERGFAYSDIDLTPEPGEPGVSTVVVPGGVGAMSGTLPNLFTSATYYYQAYAKNLVGTGLSGVLSFTTTGACAEISISPSAMPNGIVGSAYSPLTPFTFTATGGGPYTFTYAGLPPGLNGSSGGVVSGSPTAAGTYSVEVVATEAVTGCWASRTMNVLIGSAVIEGSVVVSEFRTHGPGEPYYGYPGYDDDYVEIGNRTSGDIVVASTDGSGGWSIGRPGEVLAFIDDGTVIKKGGHWLATGWDFSLYQYGSPDPVWWGDEDLWNDIPDDVGIGLFTTQDPGSYSIATRLDAVGGTQETDPLFYKGTPLPEVVQAGSADPYYQVAWVRRVDNSGILSNTGDNERDFVFIATDAGSNYGPAGDFPAVLGGPGPEDSYTVHDVLQAEFQASLLDPTKAENRTPNREVSPYPWWVDYRRVFRNNTGQDIYSLAFKVINVTTLNSRKTLAVQAGLTPTDAPPISQLEVPVGSNNFVDLLGSNLDYPVMYPRTYWNFLIDADVPVGGINSRLIVPFNFSPPPQYLRAKGPVDGVLPAGESLAVNFRAAVYSPGYYLWVVLAQVSFDPPCNCSGFAAAARPGAVKPVRPRRERTNTHPSGRR